MAARGDSYRNRALALLQQARRWRGETRKASDYLTAGWVLTVENADAADERADRAEAELAAARARVAALESGAGQLRAALERIAFGARTGRTNVRDARGKFVMLRRSDIAELATAALTAAAPTAAADTGAEARQQERGE